MPVGQTQKHFPPFWETSEIEGDDCHSPLACTRNGGFSKPMDEMIQNLINGNLSDAKRQARRFSLRKIQRYLTDNAGWSPLRAVAAADYLKGLGTWAHETELPLTNRASSVRQVRRRETSSAPLQSNNLYERKKRT